MDIKIMPMGEYQTNCYIVTINEKDFVIDPGVGATSWVVQNTTNVVAILNTHGHFDHIWSNNELQKKLNTKVYAPIDDAFMIEEDIFGYGFVPCKIDIKVKPNETINFDGIKVKFHHFSGHTPGCSAIEINDTLFSGDFIFRNTIGRCDFPYSNAQDMKNSIEKVLSWDRDIKIYAGHGASTTLDYERESLKKWLNYL